MLHSRNWTKFKLRTIRLTGQPKKEEPVGIMATHGKYLIDQEDTVNLNKLYNDKCNDSINNNNKWVY